MFICRKEGQNTKRGLLIIARTSAEARSMLIHPMSQHPSKSFTHAMHTYTLKQCPHLELHKKRHLEMWRAVRRFGFETETWNLLRPVDLMAYSMAAWHERVYDLRTADQPRTAVRGGTTILQEYPGCQSAPEPTSPLSTVVADSPTAAFEVQSSIAFDAEAHKSMPRVLTMERDLERGG